MALDEIDGMQSIDDSRQPLDITKELFTGENSKTKSHLTSREIMVIARASWFARQYNIPEINVLIEELLLLRRSKGGMTLKAFADTLKGMKPSFETKEGEGIMKI